MWKDLDSCVVVHIVEEVVGGSMDDRRCAIVRYAVDLYISKITGLPACCMLKADILFQCEWCGVR